MKLPQQDSRKWFIIPIFLLTVGFIVFVPKPLSSQTLVQTAKYDYTGPHMFSAWAIIRSDSHPVGVTANNTGIMPEYLTLKDLNQTIIGMHWIGNAWQNLTQTGWYWDVNHSLLYLHFQTWNNNRYHVTEISVDFPPDIVTITQTVTETVTTIQTVTVTSTVVVTVVPTVTVTVTAITVRTCTNVCLP